MLRRPRFLLLTSLLAVLSGLAAWVGSHHLAQRVVSEWALRYADKQVTLDRHLSFAPLAREIALARRLAASPSLIAWARAPESVTRSRDAAAELLRYRDRSAGQNAYVILAEGAHTRYQGDAAPVRFQLDSEAPGDRWFFEQIAAQRDLWVHVNADPRLGTTRVWINVLLRDGNTVLGVAGTGLPLAEFRDALTDQPAAGISSLYVDHRGAIELFRARDSTDFASVARAAADHQTLETLFDRSADQQALRAALKEAERAPHRVVGVRLVKDERRMVAGVAWLPEVEWFDITLVDTDALLPPAPFLRIAIASALMVLLALALYQWLLWQRLLRPMARLECALRDLKHGRFDPVSLPEGGEPAVQRLATQIADVAATVTPSPSTETDTAASPNRLARNGKSDPLTDLLNRRGMSERLNGQINRARRNSSRFGLLLIDVDGFRDINQRHGEAVGDRVLVAVARLIAMTLRPYDLAARWEDDTFLVLVDDCDEKRLAQLAERLRSGLTGDAAPRIDGEPALRPTVSIGATLARAPHSLARLLEDAGRALAEARAHGGNQVRQYITAPGNIPT